MNPVTIALVSLRGLALAMSISGRLAEAEQLFKLGDLVAAGVATDAHMQRVAELLAVRNATALDLSEVIASIESERAKLHDDNASAG
jgi:hypothetical protein